MWISQNAIVRRHDSVVVNRGSGDEHSISWIAMQLSGEFVGCDRNFVVERDRGCQQRVQ